MTYFAWFRMVLTCSLKVKVVFLTLRSTHASALTISCFGKYVALRHLFRLLDTDIVGPVIAGSLNPCGSLPEPIPATLGSTNKIDLEFLVREKKCIFNFEVKCFLKTPLFYVEGGRGANVIMSICS